MKCLGVGILIFVSFLASIVITSAECGEYSKQYPIFTYASSESPEYGAVKAIDKDARTHWKSDANAKFPQWIQFDLGERKCIKEVELYFNKAYMPINYTIESSNDLDNWREISEEKSAVAGGYITNEIAENQARYLRIMINSGEKGIATLSEISVMGAKINEAFGYSVAGSISGVFRDNAPMLVGSPIPGSDPARKTTHGSNIKPKFKKINGKDYRLFSSDEIKIVPRVY